MFSIPPAIAFFFYENGISPEGTAKVRGKERAAPSDSKKNLQKPTVTPEHDHSEEERRLYIIVDGAAGRHIFVPLSPLNRSAASRPPLLPVTRKEDRPGVCPDQTAAIPEKAPSRSFAAEFPAARLPTGSIGPLGSGKTRCSNDGLLVLPVPGPLNGLTRSRGTGERLG